MYYLAFNYEVMYKIDEESLLQIRKKIVSQNYQEQSLIAKYYFDTYMTVIIM